MIFVLPLKVNNNVNHLDRSSNAQSGQLMVRKPTYTGS